VIKDHIHNRLEVIQEPMVKLPETQRVFLITTDLRVARIDTLEGSGVRNVEVEQCQQ
jgi:hypothetical protein